MSSRIDIVSTQIDGLLVLERKLIGDHRGYLERMFCLQELSSVLSDKQIVQINHTLTKKEGTVRGMHFQNPPHAEIKFVSCIRGTIFDVAVDLRSNSSTFLKWHGEILSEGNHRSLVIPEGFAHGFQALSDECELVYFHTGFYNAASEGGLNAKDPCLDIKWPLSISEISTRDQMHPMLNNRYAGIVI